MIANAAVVVEVEIRPISHEGTVSEFHTVSSPGLHCVFPFFIMKRLHFKSSIAFHFVILTVFHIGLIRNI